MKHDLTDRPWLLASLLGIAALLCYANSLANGFALDDVAIILDNARVHNLSDQRAIWLTPYWPYFGPILGLWRPIAIFGYAVQWAAGGGDPWVFHAVNITLHALVTLLAFFLLRRLTNTTAAFAGALVFAVHPVHAEAVANVVGQAELIGAVGVIGACLVHATRPDGLSVSWPRRVALLLLFTIGLLAKENTVVLPGLLLITDLAQRRIPLSLPGARRYIDAMLMPMLLLGAALACYLIFRFDVLDGSITGSDPGPTLPFLREAHRVLNALRAFPEFLRLLIFPLDLSADYSPGIVLPVQSPTPMTLVGALLLAALVTLAAVTPWRPAIGFPAAWFLISIVTVSNLFFPIGVLIAERTLYLPSFAISALVAFAWLHGSAHASAGMRRAAPVMLALVVLLMGVRTWVRNPDWSSTGSVVNALLRDRPESYRAQWVAAVNQWRAGNIESAADHFELGLRIYPHDPQFRLEYANFLITVDRNEEALRLLEGVYETHPYVTRSLALLSYAYLTAGRYADALRVAREAERLNAPRGTILVLQAHALDGLGDHGNAIGTWRVATQFAISLHWSTFSYLARSLALHGDEGSALNVVEQSRILAAHDPEGLERIDALERAIRAGCYNDPGQPEGTTRTTGRTCDPLAGWFHVPVPPQNANPLQNARRRQAAGP